VRVEFRPEDPIRPEDDVVLRGGGSVDNLVARALEHARDYRHLVEAGEQSEVGGGGSGDPPTAWSQPKP
jgi:hypothetical protein